METFTIGLGCWGARLLGRNPLVRNVDRMESVMLAILATLCLLALPIAASMGTFVHDSRARAYVEDAQSKHQVTAVAIEDGHGSISGRKVAFTARATWRFGGREHDGVIAWPTRPDKGAQQGMWVNSEGVSVRAPRPQARAVGEAVLVGLSAWVAMAAAAASLVYVVHRKFDRVRSAAWDRELRLIREKGNWGNR
ncbi:Rv1733c family protein [Mycolicibacterium nivoides]|uniref:Transmembrane protein n=1 Tax=Mycolicibacterium nivoides TaxID=2487344 RepID=A0ABW9LD22_9MYCO